MSAQTAMPVAQRERCVGVKADGTRCTRLEHRAGEAYCRQHAGKAAPHTPTGLTQDDQDKLFEALEDGLALDAACVVAGVSRSTVYDWLARARLEGSHPVYREFEAGIEAARVRLEHWTLAQLKRAAAKGSVPAMRTILQRRSPHAPSSADEGQLRMPTEQGKRRRGAGADDDAPDNVIPLNPTGTDDFDW